MGRRTRMWRTGCAALAVLALSVGSAGCDEVHIDTGNGPRLGDTSAGAAPTGGPPESGGEAGEEPTDGDAKPGASRSEPAAEQPKPDSGRSEPTNDPHGGLPAPLLREGSEGKQVREVQARLQQLRLFERNPSGYYGTMTSASVRALQKRVGLAQSGTTTSATWVALRRQTRTPTAEQLNPQTSYPLAAPDERCKTGRVLCVSKKSRTLAWMVDGEVRVAMDVRFGSQYTPTREGAFKVDFKSRDHHSTLYDTPMPYAMFFSGGQAVHYSADFAATGYTGASHGCVNVREKEKIAKVFSEVKDGDKVVVYS